MQIINWVLYKKTRYYVYMSENNLFNEKIYI